VTAALARFVANVAESRSEGPKWLDADRAVRCCEPDCRTIHDNLGGACPRCTSTNGVPLAALLDGERPVSDGDDDHARALAEAGMPENAGGAA
jgi:hypothetical protein